MRSKLEFFYVEAGGGHKAAATALKAVIEAQQRPWDVTLTNLNHVLGSIDILKKLSGRGVEDLYNLMLKKGWTILAAPLMRPMHALIWAYHPLQKRLIEQHWRAHRPDMVVSLIPHFNRALFQALQNVNPAAPYVEILTDFADIPPRVWIERQGPQHVICGTDKAVSQALAFGHPAERVHRVSGMILRPSFYDLPPVDRGAARAAIGLRPDRPTALVLFGGEGSSAMVEIARRLSDAGLDLQLILMYGRNERLGARLRALDLRIPAHVQGFTAEVPRFMQLADFMIGKPGPGSISEALALHLPVIVDRNAWTMPQERYNAEWLGEQRVGLVVRQWSEIDGAVRSLLAPGALEGYRNRAAQVRNRAVFEIAGLLERILAASR